MTRASRKPRTKPPLVAATNVESAVTASAAFSTTAWGVIPVRASTHRRASVTQGSATTSATEATGRLWNLSRNRVTARVAWPNGTCR